jgi:hypothetical protein
MSEIQSSKLAQTWAVVGAGAAGIAVVGKLLDQGIEPKNITWIDPEFKVGDLGDKWQAVPSNTKAKFFTMFLEACNAFNIEHAPHFPLFDIDPEETCFLARMVEPLQWISDHLSQKVKAIKDSCIDVTTLGDQWQIHLQSGDKVQVDRVMLATGSDPKQALYKEPEVISLQTALTPSLLADAVDSDSVVAVFGSSHSAVLVIKNLLEQGVKQVINFYRSPLRYAVYHDDWILYDNTGLKGTAATWAKENLEDGLPENLVRVVSNEENIQNYLPKANKAVYPVGFDTREISVNGAVANKHDTQTGKIENNLYGMGIAFPELITDRAGNVENNIGLWKFMKYINRNIDLWTAN